MHPCRSLGVRSDNVGLCRIVTKRRRLSYCQQDRLECALAAPVCFSLLKSAAACSVQVFDRTEKSLKEELIDNKIVMAMRAIYQSKLGLVLLDAGKQAAPLKVTMSERESDHNLWRSYILMQTACAADGSDANA